MKKLILAFLLCAPAFSQDWQNPAYWGLPKGSYIPAPGCWGGNWKSTRNHNKFDFEICASVTYL